MNHETLIIQCNAHPIERFPMGMFYYTCTCGIHSQCWETRKMAKDMAAFHESR